MRNERGQSTVEYILLFAVVVSLAFTVFNGLGFNRIFGADGEVATAYKNQLEFSYRHGFLKKGNYVEPNYANGNHETYQNRFFSALDPYPPQ